MKIIIVSTLLALAASTNAVAIDRRAVSASVSVKVAA